MRPGWNPTRRNRHVGTKAHGHGKNNQMLIPESWHDLKRYYERLSSYSVVTRSLGTRQLKFFIEPTRPDWFYPCTVDDICAVLSLCSQDEQSAFDFIVLRQPTRKQRFLCPVWGRAIFSFEIEKSSGAAIVIEAQNLDPIKWPKSLGPERARELDRLRADGHNILNTRRGIEIFSTPDSLRNTVLYRTLLHEIGHHMDFKSCSMDEWAAKTPSTKEDFAHRYALDLLKRLAARAPLPLDAGFDASSLLRDGLSSAWFTVP